MNYHAHYRKLIDRAKFRVLVGYAERHHIVPRCMGGDNAVENLVWLTAEEHYCAHLLLVKMFPGHHRLVHAAHMMTVSRLPGRFGNKGYGWLRRKNAEAISISMKGKKRAPFTSEHIARLTLANKARKHTAEQHEKIAAKRRGTKMSDETRAKMAVARLGNKNRLGIKHDQATKERIAASLLGKRRGPMSADHRAKISEAKKAKFAAMRAS